MLRPKILPIILLWFPASVLTAQSTLSEPAVAAVCKLRPGSTTPHGGHWYYHIERKDKRHCWFLSLVKLLPRREKSPRPVSTQTSAAQSANAGPINAPAPAASGSETDFAPPSPAAAMTAPTNAAASSPTNQNEPALFAARWPSGLPGAAAVEPAKSEPVSSSYAERSAAREPTAQMPPWPLIAAAQSQPGLAANTTLRFFSLAGGLMIPFVLLAGWVGRFTRRPYRASLRTSWASITARLGGDAARPQTAAYTPAAAMRSGGIRRAPIPTDPALDLKASLAELMGDLRRVDAGILADQMRRRRAG